MLDIMLDIPRDIKLVRKPNQTEKVILLGKDEFCNTKEEVIFCTPEEAEQINLILRKHKAKGERNDT